MDAKEFLRRVEAYILEKQLIKRGDRILLGLSGGADSVCLFSVFLFLQKKYGLSLLAVHVNHKLRGEDSDGDEEFVRKLCEEYGVGCKCFSVDVGQKAADEKLSVEEAGRNLRYGIFEDVAKEWNADRIAVAHHENDQAETVLFNLFRGSSLRGLTGIHAMNGKIIRPLLCVSREAVEAYLKETGMSYRTDISNFSKEYKRNFIRNEIFPAAVRHVNAGAVRHTARLAGELLEIYEYMEEVSLRAYGECCHEFKEEILTDSFEVSGHDETLSPVDGISVDIGRFMAEPEAIQKCVLINAVSAVAGRRKDISFVNISQLLNLFSMENGKRVDMPYNLYAVREYGYVRIIRKEQKEGFSIPIEISGLRTFSSTGISYGESGFLGEKGTDYVETRLSYDVNFGFRDLAEKEKSTNFSSLKCYIMEKTEKIINIPKNDYTKWLDCDKISKGIIIRNRKAGDYMEIDRMGHRKKLKEIFINEKYPKSQRDLIPLLADGSHIIWILGGRISEAYKVTEQTKRILVCELTGGTRLDR